MYFPLSFYSAEVAVTTLGKTEFLYGREKKLECIGTAIPPMGCQMCTKFGEDFVLFSILTLDFFSPPFSSSQTPFLGWLPPCSS